MKIKFTETAGIQRIDEPVSLGVPFPRGHATDPDQLVLKTDKGTVLPFGHTVTAVWPDHSIRWLLLDIQVSVDPHDTVCLELEKSADIKLRVDDTGACSPLKICRRQSPDRIVVESDQITATMNTTGVFQPFNQASFHGRQVCLPGKSAVVLKDCSGIVRQPVIEEAGIVHDTLLRKTICTRGWFENETRSRFLRFECRAHFFSGIPRVRFEFGICNTRAAVHPGGAWDLGDENAFYFRSLTVLLPLNEAEPGMVFYTPESANQPVREMGRSCVRIYQDSSGHENWFSSNHVNKDGHVPLQFRGYKVFHDGGVAGSGCHASPFMGAAGPGTAVGVYVTDFWQNFPKSLTAGRQELEIGLFPEGFGDLFELQPGEQKTHVFDVGFAPDMAGILSLSLSADPLVPHISRKEYRQAVPWPGPVPLKKRGQNTDIDLYDRLVAGFISQDTGYEQKNIRIDEFGWRHFGDIYADHEAVSAPSDQIFVSHYNNQYDVIKGAVIQFMRTHDPKWFTLAEHLADHVVDIDIYHTEKDKYQYNHGLFWHTDHHLPACTATHRTVSRAHQDLKPDKAVGGGPSVEHNYTTGLLYLHWLTGKPKYKKAVKDLAGYVIHQMEGPDTLSEMVFQQTRHLAARFRSLFSNPGPRIYQFDGPGRASGNALNTLLDGYLLTGDLLYLDHAQALVVQTVSPEDDLEAMDLLNAEIRWSYTIFLQALGRYLETLLSLGRVDDWSAHARESLLHYAGWMAENEYPYLEKPEILEFPTETWAAQDLRKSDVFAWAAFFSQGSEKKKKYEEKSRFFFSHAVQELSRFETRYFTRPMALVMSNGLVCMAMMTPGANMGQNGSFAGSSCHGAKFKRMRGNQRFLKQFFRNLARVSLEKEWQWVSRQCQQVLKRQGSDV